VRFPSFSSFLLSFHSFFSLLFPLVFSFFPFFFLLFCSPLITAPGN